MNQRGWVVILNMCSDTQYEQKKDIYLQIQIKLTKTIT